MGQIFPFLHWDFFCFCVWIVCLCTAPVQYVFIRNFGFFFFPLEEGMVGFRARHTIKKLPCLTCYYYYYYYLSLNINSRRITRSPNYFN